MVLMSKKIVASLFLSIFLAQLLLSPAFVFAKNNTNRQKYSVKFVNSKFANLLNSVGENIEKRFVWSKAQEFKDIYTFDSGYDFNFLNSYFQNSVVYLEPLTEYKAQAVVVNDPGFTSNPLDIDKTWAISKAGFDIAWQKTTGITNNVVAIIDTGVDQTHEDLRDGRYVDGYDFVNDHSILKDENSDDNGHGTLVAGILAATANNNKGIAGTNWAVTIMPIKSLDASGKGDAAILAEGIVWAADHGAQFINLSIGGVGFAHDTSLADAVSYAFNKNIFLAAAAGNDVATTGGNLDTNPVFPICNDNNSNMVVGVVATDNSDLKPAFSNFGKNCIDVSAPGKRILSTINFDPATKKSAPNSYAYGSGTSLAVPFVVGQAALIKALYPVASNVQIRDRIIATADPIDNLNLSQCGGSSCSGLLGAGRINVTKSLEQAILLSFSEGDVVRVTDQNDLVYQISGGQKRLISQFVFNQRFANMPLKLGSTSQLANYPQGPYVTPLDGTLVKLDLSPTVYFIDNGQKLPVTFEVFNQRKMNFADVHALSFLEINSWTQGSFLPPLEGTLLKTSKNKTVYWVVGQVLHPVNYQFFIERGLNIFPILIVSDNDIFSFPKGEAFIR